MPSSGLSRTTKTHYPFQFKPFDKNTGAEAGVAGAVHSRQFKYTKNSKQCYAGLQGDSSYVSCGQGEASAADIFDNGATVTAPSSGGTTYTLHHSNAKLVKYVVAKQTITEFDSAYYMLASYSNSGDGSFWQYILKYNSHATTFIIAFKRSWNTGTSAWNDFTSDGVNTFTIQSVHRTNPCWKDARYYTGANKPASNVDQFRASYEEWVYVAADSGVYFQKQVRETVWIRIICLINK